MTKQDVSILVVDDEEAVLRVLSRTLERGRYANVTTALSASEARSLLTSRHFDLVITDVQMPGGSGIELVMDIHHEDRGIATLMVTGLDDAALAESALDLGAYGYLIKPVKPNELLINTSNALRRRDLELENRRHTERLEDMVKERTRHLWDALNELEQERSSVRASRAETIERLATAAELRDAETGSHVLRMSRYAELIARAAGATPEFCETLGQATQMHDIGKIGIPDRILLKPGRLTPEERAVMQTHTEIGHRILTGSRSPLLEMGATIALTHHERIDGMGYPNKLRGSEIPFEGRVAAIADVFDALTTNRVYRRAYPFGNAVEMMKDGQGKHFDGDLLDLFWGVLPEVLHIQEQYESTGLAPAI